METLVNFNLFGDAERAWREFEEHDKRAEKLLYAWRSREGVDAHQLEELLALRRAATNGFLVFDKEEEDDLCSGTYDINFESI